MYVCIYRCFTSNFVYIGVASSHRKCAISDIAITSARNNIFSQDKKQLIGHREGFIYFRSRVGQGACQHPNIDIYIYIYISQQSILKQGFQKTHFPTVLEVENFFAVDLANF